jgi:hypothetical protein
VAVKDGDFGAFFGRFSLFWTRNKLTFCQVFELRDRRTVKNNRRRQYLRADDVKTIKQ